MGLIQTIRESLLSKRYSCEELTKRYLDSSAENAGSSGTSLNAYITLTREEALLAARCTDEAIAAGEPLPPLAGIPMALKDNISTKGIRTTCASRILEHYIPAFDAHYWAKLKEAGAVLLGKTNLDEFAMGSTGETSYFGGVRNPLNPAYSCGGSSSGTAAAVAGGLAVYGIGTDSGGSIRQPAAFCGLVGLKPTYGAVSRSGVMGGASSLDASGPIAATVADAAEVFAAMSGYDPGDSTCVKDRPASPDFPGIKGLRVGIIREALNSAEPAVAAAVSAAADWFVSQGAILTEYSVPELEAAFAANLVISCAEGASNMGRYNGVLVGRRPEEFHDSADMVFKARGEGFGFEVKRRILFGQYVLSAEHFDSVYKKAQGVRAVMLRRFTGLLETCDILLTPTAPCTAYPFGKKLFSESADLLTAVANLCGLPALTLPCGMAPAGNGGGQLPMGLQLIGAPFSEPLLFGVAGAYESAHPFANIILERHERHGL